MSVPAAPDARDPWARRRRRPWLWTIGAVAGSAAIVLGAWMIDRGRAPAPGPARVRERPVADLVAPAPLSEQERGGTGPRFGSQESVRLEQGAWVQVADRAGRLKQQYTASRIDPLPDKRLDMQAPRAVLYGDGGRVVTMRGDRMTARVPRRELESGRIDGNVVIRVYRAPEGRAVDLRTDAPEIVVEAPEATFDAESGEVRCDREFRIIGDALNFEGQGLSLTLSTDGRTVERLVIDRALSPARIVRPKAAPGGPRGRASGASAPAGAGVGWVPAMVIASAPPVADPGRLFVLTLYDGVEVVSVEGERVTTLTGQELEAVFVLRQGGGLGIAAAGDPFGPPEIPVAVAGPPAMQVPLLAMASIAPEDPSEDTVTVRFGGRLVMVPAGADVARPTADDGVRLTLRGSPATINDSRSEAVIVAATATFESGVERVALRGTEADPATVETPAFTLASASFDLDRAAGTGGSTSPGTIVMGPAGGKPLLVSWSHEMSLRLAPGTGDAQGAFRGASFLGDVDVRGTDFQMQAATLNVQARPVGTKDVVRRIVADGGVRAQGLGASGGTFEAKRVEVALSPNAAGDAQPRTLAATGGVMAGDGEQVLWAESLRATFVEARAGAQDDAARSDLGEVTAEGPVELRMRDGARVFASRLEGDGLGRSARLVGPDVLVVQGNLVLDQLAEVRVEESPARVRALGPGRASSFVQPVLAAADGRVGRPRIDGVPRMQATWRESLAYAEDATDAAQAAGPGRGLLLLQGAVKVRASREAREAEALDADEVQVELRPRGEDGAMAMGTMRASGEVRLEARQWTDARRQGEPRVFRMNAPNVSYDGASGSAAVDGAGALLVFDLAPAAEPADADAPKSPFSPHGTTRFTWKRSLDLERRTDGTARIVLEREVVMDHLGISTAATGTVSADRMVATVRGVEAGAPAAAGADGALALGGPAELTRVFADGRVQVRTQSMDVEAGEFDLDVPSQVGVARGGPGRLVTIIQRGGTAPMRAHAFRWDLVKGTLTVEGARGAIGR